MYVLQKIKVSHPQRSFPSYGFFSSGERAHLYRCLCRVRGKCVTRLTHVSSLRHTRQHETIHICTPSSQVRSVINVFGFGIVFGIGQLLGSTQIIRSLPSLVCPTFFHYFCVSPILDFKTINKEIERILVYKMTEILHDGHQQNKQRLKVDSEKHFIICPL